MSFHCLKCAEVWAHEDYQCSACDSAAVDPESNLEPTCDFTFIKQPSCYIGAPF